MERNNKLNIDNIDKLKGVIREKLALYKFSLDISEYSSFLPEHVNIEPTNACNLRCIHCHQSKPGEKFTKKRGMMNFEVYKKVIDECKTFAVRVTLDSQGEPLLHPQIIKMVEYAKKSGLSVSLLTNATRLTDNIARNLIDLNLDRIVFSFEGSNKEIHEKVRKNSVYEDTLHNILRFLKLNYEAGMKVFVCMSMVKSSYTEKDVEQYKEYFERLPINTIFVSDLLSISGTSEISSEIDFSKYEGMKPICRMPWESIAVNWDGTVSPCALDYNESHFVGNVVDDTLVNIFNNEAIRKFRKSHIENDFSHIEEKGSLCATCNCRFNDEYDLNDIEDYVINSIVRQTKIMNENKEKIIVDKDKIDFLEAEIAKLNKIG